MPRAAGALIAEAVVRHARNPDSLAPAVVPASEVESRDPGERWPAGLRILFLIGAAAACWAIVLLAAWWLIG